MGRAQRDSSFAVFFAGGRGSGANVRAKNKGGGAIDGHSEKLSGD